MSGSARSIVHVDNEHVRVTEWRFAPGEATGRHRHEYDYVIVPLTEGPLRVRSAQGETVNELVVGRAYFREAGVEHDVSNPNSHEVAFVETELKGTRRP